MSRKDSPDPDSSGAAAVRLLRAASDLMGGDDRLAARLNVDAVLLKRYTAGRDELPPHILLRAVDLLLEAREERFALPGPATASASGATDAADVPA